MVQPTGADDADMKLFGNLVSFLACDDAVGFNSPAASTTEPLGSINADSSNSKNSPRIEKRLPESIKRPTYWLKQTNWFLE